MTPFTPDQRRELIATCEQIEREPKLYGDAVKLASALHSILTTPVEEVAEIEVRHKIAEGLRNDLRKHHDAGLGWITFHGLDAHKDRATLLRILKAHGLVEGK